MNIKRAVPHPALRSVVRLFEERRVDLGSSILNWPAPSGPHQFLVIHLTRPYMIRVNGGPAKSVPEAFVVGPQTIPSAHVFMSGQIHVFTILFRPAGLNQLVGIDMRTLVNKISVATDLFGTSAVRIREAVRAAPDFPARVRAAEQWLDAMLNRRPTTGDEIGRASNHLMVTGGQIRIDDLVRRSALSASQFQRRFIHQVGIAPKGYARLVRFDRALILRRNAPERSWTDILHELGYFDQAHFIREFHTFAGISPTGFRGDWENIFIPGSD